MAMTAEEFDARHRERYRAVMMGEKTLPQALEENDADWQQLKAHVEHDATRTNKPLFLGACCPQPQEETQASTPP